MELTIFLIVGLVSLGLLSLIVLAPGQSQLDTLAGGSQVSFSNFQKTLLHQLACLEEAFEHGQVDPAVYRREYERLKAELEATL